MQVVSKRTTGAICRASAMRLADSDGKRMKLVEQAKLLGFGISGKGGARQGAHRLITPAVVAERSYEQMMALGYAPQILVCHRNRMVQSV